MKEIIIHGFKVKYEDTARPAIDFLLTDLDIDECRVFFDGAKLKKFAKFEDHQDREYTLSYNPDRSYTLIRR